MRFWLSMEGQKRINPVIMDIHNSITSMDIHNSIRDIHNSIRDIHNWIRDIRAPCVARTSAAMLLIT